MTTIPAIILEPKQDYISHDRLFKELIKTFFQEYIEGFFPDTYLIIDFSSVTFLEQEVFTDILIGEKREIDILAEVNLEDDSSILIHIEPQSTYQKEFHERMFIYHSRLYEKYRKPIISIAVFSYNDRREVPSKFINNIPRQTVLEFHYLQMHLIKLNWRDFIGNDNPAIAALLSKMDYTKEERVLVKFEFLRMISRLELNQAQMELVSGFFDMYLKLNDEEEKQLQDKISHLPKEEADRVLEIPNYYFDKGVEKGKEEGKLEGRQEGKREEIEKIVFNMIKSGFSDEIICDVTGASIVKVKELRNKYNEKNV